MKWSIQLQYFLQNQVNKKIVWKLHKTKEEFEAFKVGERIDSTWINVMIRDNLTKWSLSFFPRGHAWREDGVSLFLYLAEADPKEFHAKFTLGVVGTKGNKEQNFECPGKSFNSGYGYPVLLKQDELFNLDRGYFTDGKLTLYCKLTLSDDVTERDGPALSKQNILSDLQRMLDDELFTDFEMETSDEKILKAHKIILAARSPYFHGMLKSDMKETETKVMNVPENSVTMKAFLSFIYSGKVDNLNEIASDLVSVAQKYQLNELKELCIESIIKSVSCDNAVETLLAAERLTDSKELKKKCIDVVASNFAFLRTTAESYKMSCQ